MRYLITSLVLFCLSCSSHQDKTTSAPAQVEDNYYPKGDLTRTEEDLLGCWMMTKNSKIRIQFNRFKSFTLVDYNKRTKTYENISGDFSARYPALHLAYADRTGQDFKLVYKDGDDYIMNTSETYIFKKVEGNCGYESMSDEEEEVSLDERVDARSGSNLSEKKALSDSIRKDSTRLPK